MINIVNIENWKSRAFGWVQDPSNMRSLCDVVSVFDINSNKYKELYSNLIPSKVLKRDGRNVLLQALAKRPLKLAYRDLVGTSFTPRSSARCNGIIQACVAGQKRPFIADWPADNFVRWAEAFGFITYDYISDSFEISPTGLELSKSKTSGSELNDNEIRILTEAVLSYPPAIRILQLLSPNKHLSKFELGDNLGFKGEDGFTSMPQDLLIKTIIATDSSKEQNKIKCDWEGSADKYARMIATWLCKLSLVEQKSKTYIEIQNGKEQSVSLGQAYMLTAKGLMSLKKASGNSRHKRIAKKVSFEMLSTKASDKDYIRTRRALILKKLSEKKIVGLEELIKYIAFYKIDENKETIVDDLNGLINIGINISMQNSTIKLNDLILDFIIPIPQILKKSTLEEEKSNLRTQLTALSHKYLSLIDLAFDGKQNRLFELSTLELLTKECGFQGSHLGGSRKPDGVIYTDGTRKNFGVIIDTKAYGGGYSLPISQADEMERYIVENIRRDVVINPNKWWEIFPADLNIFYFFFISGKFISSYQKRIDMIRDKTGIKGGALDVINLLIYADSIKRGDKKKKDLIAFCN